MNLSKDLISQFVKATKDTTTVKKESTVYGTVVKYNEKTYVKIDGSDLLTPAETLSSVEDGERVSIMIKDHTATITGNYTAPSASSIKVDGMDADLKANTADIKNLVAKNAEIENLVASKATIDDLQAANAEIDTLKSNYAEIETLVADKASIGDLAAVNADIKSLKADKADIAHLEANYATIGSLNAVYADVTRLEANKADITDLTATNAVIEELKANKANISDLEANYATIKQLDATNANVTNLQTETANINKALIDKADISDLNATNAKVNNLQATKANVTDLNATNANVNTLTGDLAEITTLVNGNLTSDNIQSMVITGDKFTVEDGFIKNAMIDSVNANKINTGVINTNNVKIQSNDGSMILQGNLQQFKDKNGKVRIQIGKDATGNFTFVLYDENGTGQLINQNGIQSSNAIADGLIVDSKVADNANIAGSKLDIDSVVTEVNNGTTSIKGTKIYLDDQKQALNVAFNNMSTTVSGNTSTLESHTTSINTMNGEITQLISDTTITKQDGTTTSLKDAYNATVDTVNSHTQTIGSLETNLSKVSTGQNKWLLEMFEKGSGISGNSPITIKDIMGKSLLKAILVDDSSTSSGLNFGEEYLGRATTYVYLEADYNWGTTATSDDGSTLYLNGAVIATLESCQATSVELPFKQGWNKITWVYNEGSGLDGWQFNPRLTSLSQIKNMNAYPMTNIDEVGNMLDGDIKTVSSKQASLEQNLDGFKQTVSETYTTKTEFDNLSIGARNYYTKTCGLEILASKGTVVRDNSINGFILTANSDGKIHCRIKCIKEGNKYYTVSGYFKADTQCNVHIDVCDCDIDNKTAPTSYTKFSGTVFNNKEVGSTYNFVDIECNNIGAGNKIYFKDFKVEEGQKATSWSPAPEDVNNAINTVDGKFSNYSTTSQMNSAINQKANEITSSVSQTYATKTALTTVDNKFANYSTTSAMNSAIQQKANEITSSVSETYATKTSVTDVSNNLKNNYSTTSAMNSAINQKANEITSSVSEAYATKTALTTVDNKFANYSTTSAMNSAIQQKANEITSSVSETYATKTSLKATDDKFANYSTTSQMNSAIQQKSDAILSTVSSTYTTKADFNGLSIGGTNLFVRSDCGNGFVGVDENNSGQYVPSSKNHQTMKTLIPTNGNTKLIYQVWNPNKTSNNQNTNRVAFFNSSKAFISNYQVPMLNGNEYQTSTIDIPVNAAYIRLGAIMGPNTDTIDSTIKIKFEFGNKATDWSPAPADVDASITAVDNKFTNYSTTSQMNSAINQKANEITSTVSNTYATKAALNTVDGKFADYSTTSAMNSAIQQKANEITSTVSETYATKTALSTVDNKFANYSTTSAMNSAIQQKANEITSSVSQNYTTKADFNNLSIGGTNLARNTAISYTSAIIDSNNGGNTWYEEGHRKWWKHGIKIIADEYITFSFDYVIDWSGCSQGATDDCGVGIGGGPNPGDYAYDFFVIAKFKTYGGSNTQGHFILTFKPPAHYGEYYAFRPFRADEVGRCSGARITISNFKIERGQKATSWSPAPEDINAAISVVDGKFTNYSTTSQMNSAINQKANEITSTVSNTYATKAALNTVDGKFANYSTTSAMNSAINQKANEITSSVSETYATKTSVTDVSNNLKNNYSTTSAMNSAINQKANEITSSVSETYATKTALSTVDNKFANYSTTSQMNSAIQQKSDSILSTVSNTYTTKTDFNKIATGQNKWLLEVFDRGNVTGTGAITIRDLVDKPLKYTRLINDGNTYWTIAETYLARLTTNVYLDADYSWTVGAKSDDGGTLYLNGQVIATTTVAQKDVTLPFKKGWNKITWVYNENSGDDGAVFATKISSLSQIKNMNAYPVVNFDEIGMAINNDLKANYSTTSAMNSVINQKANEITSTVSQTYSTKEELGNLKIGGTNLFVRSDCGDGYIGVDADNVGQYVPSSKQHQTMKTLVPTNGNTKLIYQVWNPNKTSNSHNTNRVAFFNSSKTFISNYTVPMLNGNEYQTSTINIPANTAYIRLGAIMGQNNDTVDSAIKIKFEFGNKATDWSPAPEDVDNSIATVDGKFASYSTTSQMNSTINQKANEITSTVSQTYATKAALNTVDGKFANYSTTSAMNSAINQKANEITSSVSQTYATKTDFNNLQVGGTNLLPKSGNFKDNTGLWLSNGGPSVTLDSSVTYGGYSTIKIVGATGTSYNGFVQLKPNTTYTYSVLAKASKNIAGGNSSPLHMWVSTTQTSAHLEIFIANNSSIGTKWTKAWVTFKTPNDADVYYMRPFIYQIGDATVWLANAKIEEGNKATDWSPAQADIDASITAVDNKFNNYSTTSQMNSAINQKANEITSTVSSLDTKFTTNYANTVISSSTEFYLSTSNTTQINGSWSDVPSDVSQGTFLWSRTKNTKGDGSVSYTEPICVTDDTSDGYIIVLSRENQTIYCDANGNPI